MLNMPRPRKCWKNSKAYKVNNMKTLAWLVLFLFFNFGGLALGNYLMDNGPASDWYINLNQAPWTPPGWVFGVAWTLIMICFSLYLAVLFQKSNSPKAWTVFGIALLLNVSWNYIFFNKHFTVLGLITIALLTVVVFYYFLNFRSANLKNWRYLLLPYVVWMCLATSLNAYIVINN